MHATIAFALSIFHPVLLFVLAPVVLGVVHVAADVRYLVLRRRLARSWRRVVVAFCAVFVLLAILSLFGWVPWSERTQFGLVGVWAMTGVAMGFSRSRAWWRAAAGSMLVVTVSTIALCWPHAFRIAYLHGHNLIALAVWPLFFRHPMKLLRLLGVLVVLVAGLLVTGVTHRVSLESPGSRQFGLHVLELSDWVAPALRADVAIGVTSAFVFLQAIHYSIWLSVVPQAAMPGQGTLSFRQSARSLCADFGHGGVKLLIGCIAAILLLATVSVTHASTTYMTLATFHGHLELVLLLYFWVAREALAEEAFGSARGSR
jgi:hypothetical protein